MVNFKRAVGFGALIWVLIFFEVSILMFGFNLTNGAAYYIIHYILSALIVGICAVFYFNEKTKKGTSEGLKAGIIMLITGVVLDAAITVPLFVKSYAFFANSWMIAGYAIDIAVVVIVGALKK